jgi:hypothetical protein
MTIEGGAIAINECKCNSSTPYCTIHKGPYPIPANLTAR